MWRFLLLPAPYTAIAETFRSSVICKHHPLRRVHSTREVCAAVRIPRAQNILVRKTHERTEIKDTTGGLSVRCDSPAFLAPLQAVVGVATFFAMVIAHLRGRKRRVPQVEHLRYKIATRRRCAPNYSTICKFTLLWLLHCCIAEARKVLPRIYSNTHYYNRDNYLW